MAVFVSAFPFLAGLLTNSIYPAGKSKFLLQYAATDVFCCAMDVLRYGDVLFGC